MTEGDLPSRMDVSIFVGQHPDLSPHSALLGSFEKAVRDDELRKIGHSLKVSVASLQKTIKELTDENSGLRLKLAEKPSAESASSADIEKPT